MEVYVNGIRSGNHIVEAIEEILLVAFIVDGVKLRGIEESAGVQAASNSGGVAVRCARSAVQTRASGSRRPSCSGQLALVTAFAKATILLSECPALA